MLQASCGGWQDSMKLDYFDISDFDCQETGENKMCEEFLYKLDALRHACGFPFIVTSGYRSPRHSIEARKSKPGMHALGLAADIKALNGRQKYIIIQKALEMGFTGIGVAKTFIHLDIRSTTPVVWSY